MVSAKGRKGGSPKKGGGRQHAVRARPDKQTVAAAETSGVGAEAQNAAPSGQTPLPLLNLGNTCYFNSALQVLASIHSHVLPHVSFLTRLLLTTLALK